MRTLQLLTLALLATAAKADSCGATIIVPDAIPACLSGTYGAFQVSDISYTMTETGGAQLPTLLNFFANDINPLNPEFFLEPGDIPWQTGPDQTISVDLQITVTPVNALTFFNTVNGVYVDSVHSFQADAHVFLGPNESGGNVTVHATTTPEPSTLLLLATVLCLGALKVAMRRHSI